ncbi:hypothetical protein AYL99_08300 [Fonsecaea erecta]|uniref:Trichodiene synthase n=1 Tax=Fonsecaea erecta TaxID=1367422 RepID=A0A178ZD34_9EURO|nr:hypothetical protein AYL99_08300 [Fonsecaea erecta]OAP57562.1 hypothetical protein AYL99_08300 [Fonsecaea erecta]
MPSFLVELTFVLAPVLCYKMMARNGGRVITSQEGSSLFLKGPLEAPPQGSCAVVGQPDEKAETASILRDFVVNMGFNLQRQYEDTYPEQLDSIVRKRILSYNLDDRRTAHLLKLLPTCASGVQKHYTRAAIEVKAFIVLYTIFLFYIDDRVVQEPETMLAELQKLSRLNTPAAGPEKMNSLDHYSEPCLLLWSELVTSEAHVYYGPYSAGAIQKGFVEFLMGSIIEARFPEGLRQQEEGSFASIPPTAVHMLRDKAGAGEVYAHFMFPTHLAPEDEYLGKYFICVRDMMDWINFTNDIMSFYKESFAPGVQAEENTYIQNRARCEGKTALEVLRVLCDEVVGLTARIRRGLQGEAVLEDIWENYVHGYILFHACDRRYRLQELGIVRVV